MRGAAFAVAFALLAVSPSVAQVISGTIYDDRDGDGIRDPGEPGIGGVEVRLYGAAFDQTVVTASDGSYSFSPGDGQYLIAPIDPAGWRLGPTRVDGFAESTPGYIFPVGRPRLSKLDRIISNLEGGSVRYSSIGDSIAYNFNSPFGCNSTSFWYSQQFRNRLSGAGGGASVTLDEAAIKGEHTDDLLVDESGELNNVFRLIDAQPELVTISIIGNDLLDVDPGDGGGQAGTNSAVIEVLDARQNLHESLSSLLSGIPSADVMLNSLYDNEAYDCNTGNPTNFHRMWVPIVDQILRDAAWGQVRRVPVNEVAAEFAHEDQLGVCTGFDQMICTGLFDGIHPTEDGYRIVLEKVWEAAGGLTLGAGDVLGRSSHSDVDFGYLRRVRRLLPTTWEVRNGAVVQDPEAALSDADGQDAAIALGNGDEEFRLAGFADWFDEIVVVRTVAGVRYRTAGAAVDDLYRIEASVTGEFRPPPNFDYTPTNWNFYTPIVGGGGPSQPPGEDPAYPDSSTLVTPNVASHREVSALLTKNPELPPGSGEYVWPSLTHEELATAAVRVVSAPDPGATGDDDYEVLLDYAWLDLYGWEKPRPAEVTSLRVGPAAGGAIQLSFDELAGAERYNVYAGRLETVRGGAYDHGAGAPAGPYCESAVQPAGPGRLAAVLGTIQQPGGSSYFLVTAHVDDVESPSGSRSDSVEIDRSQSACR
jgi:hypothetical protein